MLAPTYDLHRVEKADDHTTADFLLDTLETCPTTQEFFESAVRLLAALFSTLCTSSVTYRRLLLSLIML